jgi:hypothetical protein
MNSLNIKKEKGKMKKMMTCHKIFQIHIYIFYIYILY